jgi:lipopolysaccharide/colanic/teichoic acid biosynthesis glycosyltransferase
MRRKLVIVVIDVFIVFFSFLFFAWLKPATVRFYIPYYISPLLFFIAVWLFISLLISKYDLFKAKRSSDVFISILISNLTILAVTTTLIFSFGAFRYSRLIVYGTFLLSTILETVLGYLYFSYRTPTEIPDFDIEEQKLPPVLDHIHPKVDSDKPDYTASREKIRKIITGEASEAVYEFIQKYADVGDPANIVLATTTKFNVDNLPAESYQSIINLKRINNIRRINKFFESVNDRLPLGGIFIDCAETYVLRAERILRKYPPVINYIYYFFDFILTRVMPKMWLTRRLYFFITLGYGRVLSKAETLGRLYSCGFEVIDEQFIDGFLYFAVRKIKAPAFDTSPTYGLFVRLTRIGKDGREIGVYKMRTMHAYSEYLQDYVYQKYHLKEGGKFSNDFRVTTTGKILRKFWLDELPMIINVFRGEMKIVGVRPLSKHYFSLYSNELREERIKHKPGLIPPFYADMPKSLEEIMASEMKYLSAHKRNPFMTDLRYFFKSLYNIIIKHARSN